MNYFFKIFFILLSGPSLLSTSAWAGETYPFVDQNHITDVSRVGHRLIVKTTNGQKTLDLDTKKWTYQVSIPTPTTSQSDDSPEEPRPIWTAIPGSEESGASGYITLDSDSKSKSWNLISHSPYEPPDYSSEALEDSNHEVSFDLPLRNSFFCGLTHLGSAWLGSSKGLMSLDLEKGTMTQYSTYPLFPIYQYQKAGTRIVFLSADGIYYLEGSKIILIPFALDGNPAGYQEMLADGNKLYFLAGPLQDNSQGFPAFGKQTLNIFNFETHKTQSVALPVRYANHLVKRGLDVIGYGLYRAFDDGFGTYDVMEGGAFCYSPEKNIMEKLSDLPISELKTEPLKAVSLFFIDVNFVAITYLNYDPENKKFIAVSSERICGSFEKKHGKYTIFKNKKYKNDHDAFNRLVNSRRSGGGYRHPLKDDFSSLQVQYETIPQNGGQARIETNPYEMMLKKPRPTPIPINTPIPTPTIGAINKWLYH